MANDAFMFQYLQEKIDKGFPSPQFTDLAQSVIGIKRRQTFEEFETDVHYFFDHIGDYEGRLRQFIGTKMHLIKLNG